MGRKDKARFGSSGRCFWHFAQMRCVFAFFAFFAFAAPPDVETGRPQDFQEFMVAPTHRAVLARRLLARRCWLGLAGSASNKMNKPRRFALTCSAFCVGH